MKCNECYWCTSNKPLNDERVCCNKESENYNKIFTEVEPTTMECEDAESEEAVDYKHMTPWNFALKYYM